MAGHMLKQAKADFFMDEKIFFVHFFFKQKKNDLHCKPFSFYAIIFICKLVVDELLVIVVPAVELSNLLTNLLRRMLSVELSHSLEVYL